MASCCRSTPASRFPANIQADGRCSICLENVVDNNSRGITKLWCGHLFHLSCIVPEFNVKGSMICPNCRKVEANEWKYSVVAVAPPSSFGDPEFLETPVAPGHSGRSLSASADPLLELGLNIGFDGGPLYGDDQANNPEGANGSPPGIPLPVVGSVDPPLELGLNVGFDGGSLYV